MIGDPPVLTLRRNFERPTAAQLAAFEGVPTGFVVDAQMGQGAIDHRIKPLWPDSAFAAPAVTAKCGPRDNMAVWIAMKVARPGDVLALHTGGYQDAAVIGDHVAAIAKSLGIVAVVTDGLVRDIEGLEAGGPAGVLPRAHPQQPVQERPLRGRHADQPRRRRGRCRRHADRRSGRRRGGAARRASTR